MTWIAVAVAGAGLVGGMMSADAQGDAAQAGADAQIASSQAGIAEQRYQFDAIRKLLDPYINAGVGAPVSRFDEAGYNKAMADYQTQMSQWNTQGGRPATEKQWRQVDRGEGYMENQLVEVPVGGAAGGLQVAPMAPTREQFTTLTGGRQGGALTAQQDMLGLNGAGSQQAAINGIQNSPLFGALAQQGETGILQNASATGGLRGGNVQGALAQFRPALLSAMLDQQYSRLGGITALGQNAAAGVGNAGMQTGNQVSQLLQQQGAAQAGAALAGGRAEAGMWDSAAGAVGVFKGLGGFNQAPAAAPAGNQYYDYGTAGQF